MEKINWSVETVLEFIEEYRKLDLIWNPQHPKHVDRGATHEAWKSLANHFGLSVLEMKRKKDSLLASYRKCRKMYSSKSEIGMDDYKPTWFAYEALDKFLGQIYIPRGGEPKNDDTEDSGIVDNSSDLYDSDFEEVPQKIEFDYHSLSDKINVIEKKPVTKDFKSPTTMNRKRRPVRMDPQIPLNKTLKLIKAAVQESSNAKGSKDQCKLYTDLLCERLRAFDDYTRDIAMHEIDNIIFRLKNPAYVSSSVFSSNSQSHELTEPLYVSTLPEFSPTHSNGSQPPSPSTC